MAVPSLPGGGPPKLLFKVSTTKPALPLGRAVSLDVIKSKNAPVPAIKHAEIHSKAMAPLNPKRPFPSLQNDRRVAPEPMEELAQPPPVPQPLPSPQQPGYIAALVKPLPSPQTPPMVPPPPAASVAILTTEGINEVETSVVTSKEATLKETPKEAPMWRVMKLDGLEGLEHDFKVVLADRSGARDLARVRGCTKKRVRLEGEEVATAGEKDILSLLGHPLQVTTYYYYYYC